MADLALALDLPSGAEALRLVDRCRGALTWVKVGPVLFVREGPALVRELRERGLRVFLDLKWHDIPATVAGAVSAAADLGVELATVHLAGGTAMLSSAAAARRNGLRLVGVGVLTSLGATELGRIVGRAVPDVGAEQVRLLGLGRESGLDGFVCAPTETPRLREAWGPGAFAVTPGIRRPGDGTQDQHRTATPAEAVRAGADLLVVGRPVTAADDPLGVLGALRMDLGAP